MSVNWGFIGPEGAGKTTGMTMINLQHLVRGGDVLTFPGYDIFDGKGKTEDHRVNIRISMEEMVTKEFAYFVGKFVSVTEIDKYMNSLRSSSVFNLLMDFIASQRRKTGMGFTYDCQEWNDLFARMRKRTHLLTLCWDLYWSPWGKDQGLGRGELMRMVTYDQLGFYTGKPWTQMRTKMLKTSKVRSFFDSYQAVSIYEGIGKKFEIEKSVVKIDYRDKLGDLESAIPMSPKDEGMHQEFDRKILDDLADQGVSPKTMGILIKRFTSGG